MCERQSVSQRTVSTNSKENLHKEVEKDLEPVRFVLTSSCTTPHLITPNHLPA